MASDAFIGGFGGYRKESSIGIEVRVPNIPLFIPDQAQQILNALIRNTINLALMEVAGRVSEEAARFADTGNLAQSFLANPANSSGGIELGRPGDVIIGRVFSSLPYAIVMENGRLAGRPISRAGIDAIGLWAQRKLGLSFEQADRAKWAIVRNIIAQGIEGKNYFEAGVRLATPKVEQMFGVLTDQIGKALVGQAPGQTGVA